MTRLPRLPWSLPRKTKSELYFCVWEENIFIRKKYQWSMSLSPWMSSPQSSFVHIIHVIVADIQFPVNCYQTQYLSWWCCLAIIFWLLKVCIVSGYKNSFHRSCNIVEDFDLTCPLPDSFTYGVSKLSSRCWRHSCLLHHSWLPFGYLWEESTTNIKHVFRIMEK